MFEVDSQLMVSTHCWSNFSLHPIFTLSSADTECVNERRRHRVYARFPRLRAQADHSTLLTFLAILEPGFWSESTTSNVTLSPTDKLKVPVFSAVTWQKISSPVSVVINPNPRWCIHFLTTPFTIPTTTTAMPTCLRRRSRPTAKVQPW